jgi:phosphomannomutase
VDGFKFTFEKGKWVMFRASGTEPVLRVYAQAPTQEEAIAILEAAKATIL